jgi:hypothetical protein
MADTIWVHSHPSSDRHCGCLVQRHERTKIHVTISWGQYGKSKREIIYDQSNYTQFTVLCEMLAHTYTNN